MIDEPISVFDTDEAFFINTARLDNLESLNFNFHKKRILDLGCGIGHLASFFVEKEADVLCVDGRKENIDSLIKRYKDLKHAVSDVENDDLSKFGLFDIVFCYGLLYHLEKIEYALHNISKICRELLLLETCICDSSQIEVKYVQDPDIANQGLKGRGSRPSPTYLVSLLKRLGFYYIYTPKRVPNHLDFKFDYRNDGSIYRDNHLFRQVFIASRNKLFNNKLKSLKDGFEFYDKSLLAKLPFPLLKYYSEYIYKPKKLMEYPDWYTGSTLDNLEKPRKKYITTWNLLGRKSNKKFTVNIKWYKNLKLRIPYLSELASCLYIEGLYEPNEFYFLNKFLKKDMCVIDIGAHIGLYSLYSAKIVGSGGLVIAFEPSKREYNILKENVRLNKLKNIKFFQKAVSINNKQVQLNVAASPFDGHNTLGGFSSKQTRKEREEKVESISLDKFAKNFHLRHLDLLKIDTEGSEYLILKGGKKLLSNFKPILIIELSDVTLNKQNHTSKEVIRLLESLNYQLLDFNAEFGGLKKINRLPYYNSKNVLAVNKHELSRFKERFYSKNYRESEKPEALFIDHSYHKFTHSTDFLIQLLRKRFNVTAFYDESWRSGKDIYVVLPESVENIFYCQVLPNYDLLKQQIEVQRKKITWFAMYDAVVTAMSGEYLNKLAKLDFKTICFSKTLFDLFRNLGFNCQYYQYYIDPSKLKGPVDNYREKTTYFWYRRKPINWQLIKKLIGNQIESVYIRNYPDIGYNSLKIHKKDFVKYKIKLVTGFLNRSEYDSILNKTNIFIAPRIMEGIDITFLEALGRGQCVIAANSPTMNEYIEHGKNGFLFDANKPKTIDLTDFEKVARKAREKAIKGFNIWQKKQTEMLNFILNE